MKVTEKKFLILLMACFCLFGYQPSLEAQSMLLESLTGPVTQNEINAFKVYVQQKITAPSYNGGNIWVYGNSGKQIEACGLMYEVSKDRDILDRMIYLCDAALAGRNDLASADIGGQVATWTGNIDPVWPSSASGVTPAGAGVEQGEILSHIAFCAKQILETPSIWNTTVSIGDPKGFGATYKARALKYIQECDYVMDNWIIPRFIRTAEYNRYYFPGAPNTYMAEAPAPWNQAWMLTNGFVRLTLCHVLLGDAPARIAQYDAIVQSNIDWFFSRLVANTSPVGTACWKWNYSLNSGLEDTNHAAYDVQGLYIAYRSGRYGITFNDMVPFANTYCDIVLATVKDGYYAGKVDGSYGSTDHSDGDNYVRDEYLYLIDFRPDQYEVMGNIEISKNKIASSPQITGRLLWQKNRRIPAPGGLTAAAYSESRIDLAWTDNSTDETAFKIIRSADQMTWDSLTTVSANVTGYSDTGLDASVTYYYRVLVLNAAGSAAYSDVASATTLNSVNLPSEPSDVICVLPVNPSGIQIRLTWTDHSGNEMLFRIERSLDGITGWNSIATVPPNTTSFLDEGLTPSTKYYYRLRAENAAGNSAYTSVSSITTSFSVVNITLNKSVTVSNVYKNNASYGGDKAVDGSITTRWATDAINEATLEVDLGGNYTFSQAVTREYNSRVSSYKIQYWTGSEWADAYTGTTIGVADKTDNFADVTGSKVRLNILSCSTAGPSIYEFAVYGYESTGSGLENHGGSSGTDLWYTAGSSMLGFHLQEASQVKLTIYDLKGHVVKTLIDSYETAGTRFLFLNTSGLPNGVYFAGIMTRHDFKTIKMVIN